jgi:hypothetical protein
MGQSELVTCTDHAGIQLLVAFTDDSEMNDGWVLGPQGELIFWVPHEYRAGLFRAGEQDGYW